MSWSGEQAQYAGLNAIAIDGAADKATTATGTRLAFVFDSDPVTGAKADVTALGTVKTTVSGETVEVETVAVRIEIPSIDKSGLGALSIDGVYWIESGDTDAGEGVRAYGDLSTIDVTPRGITTTGDGIVKLEKEGDSSVKVQEMGEGTLRVTVTFQMKDADHHIYNVYAKYASADGSYTVLSSTVFADDPAVPQGT